MIENVAITGRLPADAAQLADVARGELAVDHADDEEERRLEQRVAEQQREAGERGIPRAEAEHDGQQAELAHRAERQDALEVGLAQRLESAEQHRERRRARSRSAARAGRPAKTGASRAIR